MVVCKFAGCKQVFSDARILPCGNRTCAAHIATMTLAIDNTKMIKCHFCRKIHAFPDDCGEFPVDTNIPLLLSMKHCDEHDSAKKSFYEVKQLLAKLVNLNEEDHVIDYFEEVVANILLEKENRQKKLDAYFKQLVCHDMIVHATSDNECATIVTNKSASSTRDATSRTTTIHCAIG